MREITLDASVWRTAEDMHASLARALGFVDGYGRNADALYDEMTSLPDTRLTLLRSRSAERRGDAAMKLLFRVIRDSARDNPVLELSEPAAEAKVRVLTHAQWMNDGALPAWRGTGYSPAAGPREDALAAAYRAIGADVLGLQEVSPRMLDCLMARLSDGAGTRYAALWGADTPVLYRQDRFDLADSAFLPLSGDGEKAGGEGTGSLCAAVFRDKAAGTYLAFASVRLSGTIGGPSDPVSRAEAAGRFLLDLAREWDTPAVLAGGFGCTRSSGPLRALEGMGYVHARDIAQRTDKGSGLHPCGPDGFAPYVPGSFRDAVDHVFVAPDPACSVFAGSFTRETGEELWPLSGHFPAVVDLTLRAD